MTTPNKALLIQALDALIEYQRIVEFDRGMQRSTDQMETDGDTDPVISALQSAIVAPEPEPVAYLAWRDGKPCYEGDDAVCKDAVWPVDGDDDRSSMPVFLHPPAVREPLHQVLTDPENQPNQYGIEFGMRGPQMTFTIGSQSFTLAYEPDEPGEFEYMRDMLIKAFSIFTPDVKIAVREQLTRQVLKAVIASVPEPDDDHVGKWVVAVCRAVEAAHGIGVKP